MAPATRIDGAAWSLTIDNPHQRESNLAEKLDAGDQFPSMTLALTGGGSFSVPGDLNANYGIVLFYRGHW